MSFLLFLSVLSLSSHYKSTSLYQYSLIILSQSAQEAKHFVFLRKIFVLVTKTRKILCVFSLFFRVSFRAETAEHPVDVRFATTEAERRPRTFEPRRGSKTQKRWYPIGYHLFRVSFRARDGTRTRGLDLGKVALHQLSHSRKERVMGIEPTYPAWKAGVLPLNYTRMGFPFLKEVGVTGFEPATSWSQTRRSSQAEPHPEGILFFLLSQVFLLLPCDKI